jgi:hypothetical protein
VATLAQFRIKFAEFKDTDDVLVVFALGEAALEMSNRVWGAFGVVGGVMTKADTAQLWLAAHKLAITPFGQAAKTVYNNKTGYKRTTYGAEFELMLRANTGGFRVA